MMLELSVVWPRRRLEVVVANLLEGRHVHSLDIRNASISNMLIEVRHELCDQVAFRWAWRRHCCVSPAHVPQVNLP